MPFVMAGLDPAIHAFVAQGKQDVDARDKPGHDEQRDGRQTDSNGSDRRPYLPPLRHARRARPRVVHRALGRGGGDRGAVRLRQEHAAVDPRRVVAAEYWGSRIARRAAGR